MDEFTARYQDFLVGYYDCVDRIVLNGYFTMAHNPGGFRCWWQNLYGSVDQLDETHLIRMAGRFSRRLHAFSESHGIPMIYAEPGQRKHDIAEEYLDKNPQSKGVFMVFVSKAPAQIWKVKRGENGFIKLYRRKSPSYVNHYHFHINDPDWGHVIIRICGHPPFQSMVILNGHEYAACQLKKADRSFCKEGNCFTEIKDTSDLALVADALRHTDAIGRLSQVCERWIYSACLCFGLSSEEQELTGFRYNFSVYQLEYSRNLHFRSGTQMEQLFDSVIDRTRSSLGVPHIKTILGRKQRPRRHNARKSAVYEEIVVETPKHNLTVFRLHFGGLTLKGYTKGERTLRFEATVHNARDLRCGRVLEKFPTIVSCLTEILSRFLNVLRGVDAPFLSDEAWESLPTPSQVGSCRVGGIDANKPRMRAVMAAVVALAPKPKGFSASDLAMQVCRQTGQSSQEYGPTHAAYDLKKLRGKSLVIRLGKSRRYAPTSDGLRAITALSVLRDKVLKPLLAAAISQERGPQPTTATILDQRYQAVRKEMQLLINELQIAA